MRMRMRLALARLSGWVGRRAGRIRALFGRGAALGAGDDGHRHLEARARFWAEHREGQREAEAQCASAAKERGV
jgi:hypothetical protein